MIPFIQIPDALCCSLSENVKSDYIYESVDNYLVLLMQTTDYYVDTLVILNEVKNLYSHISHL